MKQQVARLSPHQNGKVFAVLMAVSSLVILVPMLLVFAATAPEGSKGSLLMFVLMPLFYLLVGYISVAIGCWVYNFMYQYIGGIEFEARSSDRH